MHGYAGSILHCDLSQLKTRNISTTNYARTFLGGRGIAARLYWEQAVAEEAFGPENPIIIATGPLAGFAGLAGSRWTICSRSPSVTPQTFNYANFGGSWGAYLKFAGFDVLVIRGVADRPTYLSFTMGFVNSGTQAICGARVRLRSGKLSRKNWDRTFEY